MSLLILCIYLPQAQVGQMQRAMCSTGQCPPRTSAHRPDPQIHHARSSSNSHCYWVIIGRRQWDTPPRAVAPIPSFLEHEQNG